MWAAEEVEVFLHNLQALLDQGKEALLMLLGIPRGIHLEGTTSQGEAILQEAEEVDMAGIPQAAVDLDPATRRCLAVRTTTAWRSSRWMSSSASRLRGG